MGLFGLDSDKLFDPLDLGGSAARDAAKDAGKIQHEQFMKGLAELQRQFGISQGNIDPFVQAGQGQLPFLEQGASVEGFDQILGDIMNTDIFGELVEDRTRSVEGMLAAGGDMRSGKAIKEGARIPPDRS